MKKLLAIAVVAALTAPMAAMADTTVYGKVHGTISDTNAPGSKVRFGDGGSRIGFKGATALDNGLTALHQVETAIDLTNGAGFTGGRDTYVGLKGGFGTVLLGRLTIPSDWADDHADPMTNGAGLNNGGRANNALAYINKMGPVEVRLAHVANGLAGAGNTANDVAVKYSAGPIAASVGYNKVKGNKAGTKVALSYSGARGMVGFVHGNRVLTAASKNKFNTLTGKYNFGKAYVAAQYSKDKDSKQTQNILEVGYKLGKGTKVYFDHTAAKPALPGTTTLKTNRLGLVHAF